MTLYELAQRFIGEVREESGPGRNSPFIVWCLESCGFDSTTPDEVAWCSAWLNRLCWILRLPRTKSARARSWLAIGVPTTLQNARPGDIVVLKRGDGVQPGPEVLDAPGHVGLFSGHDGNAVYVLGGNQGNTVSVANFPVVRLLGIRRVT